MVTTITIKFARSNKAYEYLLNTTEFGLNPGSPLKAPKGCSHGKTLYEDLNIIRIENFTHKPPRVTAEIVMRPANTIEIRKLPEVPRVNVPTKRWDPERLWLECVKECTKGGEN